MAHLIVECTSVRVIQYREELHLQVQKLARDTFPQGYVGEWKVDDLWTMPVHYILRFLIGNWYAYGENMPKEVQWARVQIMMKFDDFLRQTLGHIPYTGGRVI